MSERETSGPTGRNSWIGFGAGLALVLCCAGPVLIAGGALGAIGGFLGNPLVIALGIALIFAALVFTLRRHRTGHATGDPATGNTSDPGSGTST